MSQINKKNNEDPKTCDVETYVDLTDPIADHIAGSTTINQVMSEAIRGIITIAQLRNWALELEREGFSELAAEILARIGDH